MLRWHYRSKHESLIKVSNFEFYDNRLIVFPSAANHEKLGLKLRHHPETFYDRGQSRSNKMEAAIVIEAILTHIRNYPKLSLGIVSFSNAQKEVLENLFEQARKEFPELEQYIQSHIDEPIFIKNLENVQGDERDVIFISIGYGKTKEGYLAMNFGPLNGVGGERRLNVLITRARQCCEVFTNIKAEDIDVTKTQSLGVRALKNFLFFAENGNLNMSKETGRAADSYFEIHVAERLKSLGYDIAHQVGANGFFIDLAVRDKNGNYILGIECDGRMYHSARSARDRDRLRQQVLEGMGWTIHRIWSTDWFANADRETKRTVEAIERAIIDRNKPQAALESKSKEPLIIRESVKNEKHIIKQYELANLVIQLNGKEFHQIPLATVADWLLQVVAIEAPVHMEEAGRRIIEALGVTRLGSRIRTHLEDAANFANRNKMFIKKADFLFHIDNREIQVRDRSNLLSVSRKTDLISQEEVSKAFTKVVSEAYQIQDNEAIVLAANMLGFSRLTEDLKSEFLMFFQNWKATKSD
jgi:very-short-patch-repair endonuclease